MPITLDRPLPQIAPQRGESQERFTIRAHRALAKIVTDPHERNEIVWNAWRRSLGLSDEEKIAQKSFAPDKYDCSRNQCVFAEHETIDGSGQAKKYGLLDLAKIVRHGNERIADVGAFSALADGHTPNPEEQRAAPSILGYAGPYRLGMIGYKKPRWAIFADEWHLKTAKPILEGKPRRSVELWHFKTTGKSHFDPIAAVGAEAPRLPLPQRFTTHHEHGAACERYTVAAPAYACGSNTFVKKYATNIGDSKMALDQNDLAQIMSAILSVLPQMIAEQIQAQQQQPDEGTEPGPEILDEGQGSDTSPEVPQIDDSVQPGDDDTADLNDLVAGDQDEDDKPKPAAPAPSRYSARRNGQEVTVEKYAALRSSHDHLVQDVGRLTAAMQRYEREAADAKRTMRLQSLAQQYPGVVDLHDELQLSLYSNGANMNDEAFEAHIATVEKYAARSAPTGRMLPVGEMAGAIGSSRSKYTADTVSRAVKIHTAAVNAGKSGMTWDEAIAEAEKAATN